MAAFTVADGDDLLQPIDFGQPGDRWRLDDYNITMQVKAPGTALALIEASTANGKLAIVNARDRRAEINIAWSEIADTGLGSFEFDFEMINKTTGVRTHTDIHTLTIRRTVTKTGA